MILSKNQFMGLLFAPQAYFLALTFYAVIPALFSPRRMQPESYN
ncbi:MAG: hypothetical protein WCG25_08465 [bacterium]